MLNEKMIAKLEEMGANRWTKNGMDRLYINLSALGYTCDTYKTGNVSYAEYKGEQISNSRYNKLACAKSYIDIADGSIHTTISDLIDDLKELVKAAEEAVAAEEASSEEEASEEDDAEVEVRFLTNEQLAAIIAASDCWPDTEEANEELIKRAELEFPEFKDEDFEEFEDRMYRAAEILGVEI